MNPKKWPWIGITCSIACDRQATSMQRSDILHAGSSWLRNRELAVGRIHMHKCMWLRAYQFQYHETLMLRMQIVCHWAPKRLGWIETACAIACDGDLWAMSYKGLMLCTRSVHDCESEDWQLGWGSTRKCMWLRHHQFQYHRRSGIARVKCTRLRLPEAGL